MPALVYLSGGFDITGLNDSLLEDMPHAVLLQSVEFITVLTVLQAAKWSEQKFSQIDVRTDRTISKTIWRVLLLCVVIIAAAILVYPVLLNKFRPIYFLNDSSYIAWKRNSTLAAESMSPYIYYPLSWLLGITRICGVYLLVVFIAKKGGQKAPRFRVFSYPSFSSSRF